MKALVLEIRENKAAILTSEGQIVKVDNKQYRVGQEITFKGPKEKIVDMAKYVRKWGTAIAAALFLFISLGISYISLKPYGVVSLDVNPSIEFTINRFDRVLNVSGVNDDGRGIVACIDERKLIYKNIEQAIDITLDTLRAEGYLKEEKDNYVVVAANTVKEDHTDRLVGKLDQSIAGKGNVEPITMKASDDELMEAREMGTTAGKMMIVERLDNSSREKINKSNWVNKSVASIVKECEKNNADALAASASEIKNTVKPTDIHANASVAKSTVNNNGGSSESTKMSGYSQPSNTNTQRSSSSSKPSSVNKNKAGSESAVKSSASEGAPDAEMGLEETAVGISSEPTSVPAIPSATITPAPANPAATPVSEVTPTVTAVADPIAAMPASTVPEVPAIQPAVPDNPSVQPAVNPTDPLPSQPSEVSAPSQPTSEPSAPSEPSEPTVQNPSDGTSHDQSQMTQQDTSAQNEQSASGDQGE